MPELKTSSLNDLYYNPVNQKNPIHHGSDIIIKEHNSTIKVERKVGEDVTFI